jgi:large subunit ribosomal protein L21e
MRRHGKISISRYFAEFKPGDHVCLKAETAIQSGMYHHRYHGRMGTVKAKQGSCYVVAVPVGGTVKNICLHPVHLKRLK